MNAYEFAKKDETIATASTSSALRAPSPQGEGIEDMTPAQLGGEIRLLTSQARRMALSYAIQIGYRLKLAHEKVGPHGWAEWLKTETEFSAAAASRFEALYEGYGEDQASVFGVENKFSTLKNLSVSNALRLLAVPEEEREQVAAEVDAEHLSARELEKALAERDEWKQAAVKAREEAMKEHETAKEREYDLEKARRAAEDAGPYKEKLAEAERRVKELESRPVEVAVERDEEAIKKAAEEARRAAETAAKADMDKLRERLERAQKAQKKAEDEAKKAAADAGPVREKLEADAERARKEIDELRRKLASAESGAGEVAMLARMAQTNFFAAMDKIAAMQGANPETAGKMLTGMERIVEALTERIKEVQSR